LCVRILGGQRDAPAPERRPARRVRPRGLFDGAEIDLLRRAAKEDRALDEHAFGRADGEGGTVRLSLWNHPGDGIYGMFARCEEDSPVNGTSATVFRPMSDS
jgi:ectoine hydroxylase